MPDYAHGKDCPHCGHGHSETVDTRIEGRGALETVAIRECRKCGQLWGERRDFYGVIPDA